MNFGDFAEDATVYIDFTTHDGSGALVAPSSAFVAGDFRIYKNGSATEKTTTNGITVTSPFDTITGKHLIAIDTSNDTSDVGFWTTGADYRVEINSAKTVDSQLQSGVVVGRFSIQNRSTELVVTAVDAALSAAHGAGSWNTALTETEANQLASVYGVTSQIILTDIDITVPTVDPATGDMALDAGSDYSIADGTQIDVPITTAFDITAATITWAADMGDQRIEGTGVVTSAVAPKAVSLEATAAAMNQAGGRYTYEILATNPTTGRRHVIRSGFLHLSARVLA